MEVPSRPRSANSRRPMSSSCSRRSLPVILLRPDPEGWLVTGPSCHRPASWPDARTTRLVIEPSFLDPPVRLPVSLPSSGQRTSETHPSYSATQMSRAAISICPLSTPCRAQVGSAWCRLCQDSPKDRIASQLTLRDLSLTLNSSLPNVWQIELIDQVTWCRKEIRTRLAQKNAVTAPSQDQAQSPPISAGARNDAAISPGNQRSIRRMSSSASQSGQNFSWDVRVGSNIQPMWA